MNPSMISESYCSRERLSAFGAWERLLSRMRPFMSLKRAPIAEGCNAQGTCEWSLACVYASVVRERARHSKALITPITGIRLLARVCAHVNRKVATLTEACRTNGAGKRPLVGMNALMGHERRFIAEAFPTLITSEGFFFAMDAQVLSEVGPLTERCGTLGALEWFFHRVCESMTREIGRKSKSLSALVAGVWLLPVVDAHVNIEMVLSDEGLRALRTRKGSLTRMRTEMNAQRAGSREFLPTLAAWMLLHFTRESRSGTVPRILFSTCRFRNASFGGVRYPGTL